MRLERILQEVGSLYLKNLELEESHQQLIETLRKMTEAPEESDAKAVLPKEKHEP